MLRDVEDMSSLLCAFVTIIVLSCYLVAFVLIRTVTIHKCLYLVAISLRNYKI